ncbi:hypothetical protein X975_20791, partial [Stegodyphus mimosarum]
MSKTSGSLPNGLKINVIGIEPPFVSNSIRKIEFASRTIIG